MLADPQGGELRPGWLLPRLLDGDDLYCPSINSGHRNGCWDWWLNLCETRKVPPGPIPQLTFHDHPHDDRSFSQAEIRANPLLETQGVGKTVRYLSDLCERVASEAGLGLDDALLRLVEWCLYGFGAEKEWRRSMPQEASNLLFADFQLWRLQQNPFDYPAHLYSMWAGKRAERFGFFPTPQSVVRMMVEMLYAFHRDANGDMDFEATKPLRVLDPACGTGVMLLYASNYSLNLYGIDIDPKMCAFARFNAWLYAPWLAWRPSWQTEIEGLDAATPDELRQAFSEACRDDPRNEKEPDSVKTTQLTLF